MLRVSRIMTPDVIVVSPELGLRDLMELFAKEHVSGAPVVAGHRVIGVVSLSDIVSLAASLPRSSPSRATSEETLDDVSTELFAEDEDDEEEEEESPSAFFTEMWDDEGADGSERRAASDTPGWNALDECTVRDAMTAEVLHLPPDASITRAAEFMQQHRVHRVLIMEEGALLGIVTTSDIARAVAEHQVADRRFVFGSPQRREDGSWW